MRKILITGGAGFIGSSIAEKLIDDEENFVVIVDNFSTGNPQKLPSLKSGNWKFIKCNVNKYDDISGVMLSYQFEYVFHYTLLSVLIRKILNNNECFLYATRIYF